MDQRNFTRYVMNNAKEMLKIIKSTYYTKLHGRTRFNFCDYDVTYNSMNIMLPSIFSITSKHILICNFNC